MADKPRKPSPSFSVVQVAFAWLVGLMLGTAFGVGPGWRAALSVPVGLGACITVVAVWVFTMNYWSDHD